MLKTYRHVYSGFEQCSGLGWQNNSMSMYIYILLQTEKSWLPNAINWHPDQYERTPMYLENFHMGPDVSACHSTFTVWISRVVLNWHWRLPTDQPRELLNQSKSYTQLNCPQLAKFAKSSLRNIMVIPLATSWVVLRIGVVEHVQLTPPSKN